MNEFMAGYGEYLSWVIYLALPAALLACFYLFNKKAALSVVPICLAADLLYWGKALFTSHGRGIGALFLIPQLVFVTAAAVLIRTAHKK